MSRNNRSNQWKKDRRLAHLEKKEYRYFIFCEGEKTEPLYFNALKKLIEDNPIYKDMVSIEIEPCAADTVQVLKAAKKYVSQNKIKKGQIWCVYDKDDFPSEKFNKVFFSAEILNKENKDLQYHCAWSNECIEFWFVLHFCNYSAQNNRKQYLDLLNKQFRELGVGPYRKDRDDIFSILMKHGNLQNAIKYAKKIIENNAEKSPASIYPGTKVYELVEELVRYLPEQTVVAFKE